jgi:hypothetical protein
VTPNNLFVVIAVGIAAVLLVILIVTKQHHHPEKSETLLFDEKKKTQDDDLFEDVEIMADQDNGPSLEEQFIAETVKNITEDEKRLYKNTYVPTPDGGTHVIHLMLREKNGFYIFRYLNIPYGWIVGEESSRWWIHFKSPEEKNYFDNPITAIDDDIKTMLSFFPRTSPEYYHGYVVVDDRCEIREVETDTRIRVISLSDLPHLLKEDLENNADVFSESMDRMMDRVLATMKNNVGLEQRLTHLKEEMQEENRQIRKMRDASEQAVQNTRVCDPSQMSASQQKFVDSVRQKTHEEKKIRPEDHFTRPELTLRESLILWRKQQANIEKKEPETILSDDEIIRLITVKPRTLTQLQQILGFTPGEVEKYGDDLLAMIKHMPV